MAGIKDFFRNLLYETEEEEVEQPEEPVVQPSRPVSTQPVQTTPVQSAAVPPQPPKAVVFGQLNADKLSAPDNQAPTQTRKKVSRVPVRKKVETEEYQAVISPIFGNIEDDQKDLDLVHNAIDLPKPPENMEYAQVISPMYGSQPVHIEPKKMAAPAKENLPAEPEAETEPEPAQPVTSMDLKTFLTKS